MYLKRHGHDHFSLGTLIEHLSSDSTTDARHLADLALSDARILRLSLLKAVQSIDVFHHLEVTQHSDPISFSVSILLLRLVERS